MTSTSTRSPAPAPPPAASRWSTGRVLSVVAAGTLLLVGTVLLVAGAGLAVTSAALRDDDGLVHSTPVAWSTTGYAVRSDAVRLHQPRMMGGVPHRMMGTLEVSAEGHNGRSIFVGIARTSDVDLYLDRTAGSMMHDPWDDDGSRSTFTDGAAPAVTPGVVPIWVASSAGSGSQTLRWDPQAGDWTLVVMNEDGSAPVAAEVSAAAELPVIDRLGVVLAVAGIVVFVGSGIGLIIAIPRPRQTSSPA